MKSKYLLLPLFLLSAVLAWGGGLEAPPSAGEITELKTWIDANIQATDVGAEIEGAVSAHNASAGTSVHGLGTMATEASTDYVATGTFTGHTGDKANPHGVTYTQVGAEPLGSVASHGALTAVHGVSEVADTADIPANSDFTLAGLSEKSYSSLTDKPVFGTMASETAIDYAKYSTNGSFAGRIDFKSTSPSDFIATPTINGIDVFGDISTALDEIIGAP